MINVKIFGRIEIGFKNSEKNYTEKTPNCSELKLSRQLGPE